MPTCSEALQLILDSVAPLPARSTLLFDALGLVLAGTQTSPETVPPFTNSAMDGYAVRADDCAGATPASPLFLEVLSDLPAGSVATDAVRPGTAIRIMTGAPLPAGADSVVPVEATASEGTRVRIAAPVKQGANVRLAGEDLRAGEELLPRGFALTPAALGILASVGLAEAPVHPRPRVAILTTGDELVAAAARPGPGQIRDSNIHTMCGQAVAFGAVPVPFPRVPDTREAVTAALAKARDTADVIVTNGGISVGDYDFIKAVLADLGAREVFWKVKQKPGGPLGYWLLDGKPVFGIPGNTVAAMVCMEEYVRPALRKLMGHARLLRPETTGVFEGSFRKSVQDGKVHLVRVRARREEGRLVVAPSGPQGSGILSSMLRSNALALVPADALALKTGDEVQVHLIEEPEDH
ncbi:MAG: molybdopterin molybdotransferase MoeA [Holophagales bacterium]|jgi:molybdopterin molybdotransferase|nr:molybdopterin molybdotransferase MoeA [Holophagales bacterium]